MAPERIQDCLPTLLLLLQRINLVWIKNFANNAVGTHGFEFHSRRLDAKRKLGQFVINGLDIGAGEVKGRAAVFCFHTGRKHASNLQVHCGSGGMSVGRCSVPLFDIIRRGPSIPYLTYRSGDGGL